MQETRKAFQGAYIRGGYNWSEKKKLHGSSDQNTF